MDHRRQFSHNDPIPQQIARAVSALERLLHAIDVHTTAEGTSLVPDDSQSLRTIQDGAGLAHHELHGVGWLIQQQPKAAEFQPLRSDPSHDWLWNFCLNLSHPGADHRIASSDAMKAKRKFAEWQRIAELCQPQPSPPERWAPPPGYVGVKTIMTDGRFQKSGRNPARTTIQKWIEASLKMSGVHPHINVEHAPDSNETYVPEAWALGRIERWSPRKRKA